MQREPSLTDPIVHPFLTPKQRRFCEEYCYGERAYEIFHAAERAGYKGGSTGYRVIRLKVVQDEIQRLLLTRRLKWKYQKADLENVHATIAFDPREPAKGGPSNIERMKAAVHLAQLNGWLIERTQHEVGPNLAELLAQAGRIEATMPKPEVPERLKLLQGGKE